MNILKYSLFISTQSKIIFIFKQLDNLNILIEMNFILLLGVLITFGLVSFYGVIATGLS